MEGGGGGGFRVSCIVSSYFLFRKEPKQTQLCIVSHHPSEEVKFDDFIG